MDHKPWVFTSLLTLIIISAKLKITFAAVEVLKNPDFENVNVVKDWNCNGNGCALTSSTNSYHGHHSIKVANRHGKNNGPAQNVQVTADANYNFTAYIKLLTLPRSAMYDTAELMMYCVTPSHSKGTYFAFTKVPFIEKGVWTKIGGVAHVPAGAHSCHVYVQVLGVATDYLIDHMSLQRLPDNPNWRTEANARIDKIRKADITVTLKGAHGQNYGVEMKQIKHDFGFGTAVGASQMVDPAYKKYQDFIYNNFEWAVLENALKWGRLEPHHNHANFTKALNAVNVLRKHGIKVRGHNLIWGIERHCPSWLVHMNSSQIKAEMENHIANTVTATKGLLEHWDVNNENLHGDWFEQKLHDPNVTMKMFEQVHQLEPGVKLFLNDYGIMQNILAMGLRDQALKFREAGVPIYGVGVQSHIKHAHVDINLLKARLDIVAEAGLPIWITELTVNEVDAATKAAALHDIMTLYFSHPAVEGVLLWGFWDGKMFKPKAALFEGPNFTPNAAGSVYQTLINSTWRTHEQHMVGAQESVTVRGFKGKYELKITHGGKQIAQETIAVHSSSKSVTVNVAPSQPLTFKTKKDHPSTHRLSEHWWCLILVLGTWSGLVTASPELIRNPGMENINLGADWACHGGCHMTSDPDSVSGHHSVKVTNRHKSWMGLYQYNLNVTGGENYVFTAHIKLLNLMPSTMYDSAEILMSCQKDSGGGQFSQFCMVPQIRLNRWTKLGGVHAVPQGVHSCYGYVQVHGASVSYLIDEVSLQVLPKNANWKTEANARIEKIRKADVSITVNGEPNVDYKVELTQTSHEFGFGAAVRVPQIYDTAHKAYQDFFYDNFEWAVFVNALKWHMVEPSKDHTNYHRVLQGIHALRNHGIKIRGHNIFWGPQSHAPSWLGSLSHADIKKEMDQHLKSIVGTTKGLLSHWDVNNENIHSDWYEQLTSNPNETMVMFRDTHAIDPQVKLFLNDWGIMEGTVAMETVITKTDKNRGFPTHILRYSKALRDQGELFREAGAPIYGIGVQSHIRRAHPDIDAMKAKLDIVAEAGLPIWITELSISMGYDKLKASSLHDLLTLYFSHPAIEGVLLWGFWDALIHDKSAALFEGPNLTPNAAGTTYQTLYKSTWRTKETQVVHGSGPINIRGFKGGYNLKVTHGGVEMINENFTLGSSGKALTVKLGSAGSNVIVG